MNINDITIGQAREIAAAFTGTQQLSEHPYRVGGNYFIRTVTHHYTGRLVQVHQHELVLEQAAWIADDGRFATALERCEFNEVEPYPSGSRVVIGRGAILDAVEINSIPTSQK